MNADGHGLENLGEIGPTIRRVNPSLTFSSSVYIELYPWFVLRNFGFIDHPGPSPSVALTQTSAHWDVYLQRSVMHSLMRRGDEPPEKWVRRIGFAEELRMKL